MPVEFDDRIDTDRTVIPFSSFNIPTNFFQLKTL